MFLRSPLHAILTGLLLSTAGLRAESFESFTEPYRRMELAAAETGVVTEILVEEGSVVKAGQVLASLDKDVPSLVRDIARVAAACEGQRQAAAAEVRLRDARLKKIVELNKKGHASREELLRAEAELESARGQAKVAEERRQLDQLELKKAEALLERRLIRSPVDGVVTKLHREQGEFVPPISPTVVTVVQIHPLRASFNLPASAAAGLKVGTVVKLRMADSELEPVGKIEYVAPVMDADSETVRVKVLIPDSRDRYAAGARCYIELDVPPVDKSLVNR